MWNLLQTESSELKSSAHRPFFPLKVSMCLFSWWIRVQMRLVLSILAAQSGAGAGAGAWPVEPYENKTPWMVTSGVSRVHIGKLPSLLHLFEKIIPARISLVRRPPRVWQLSLGGRGLVGAHLLCVCKSARMALVDADWPQHKSLDLLAALLHPVVEPMWY